MLLNNLRTNEHFSIFHYDERFEKDGGILDSVVKRVDCGVG